MAVNIECSYIFKIAQSKWSETPSNHTLLVLEERLLWLETKWFQNISIPTLQNILEGSQSYYVMEKYLVTIDLDTSPKTL
jgi:hypothetical protein